MTTAIFDFVVILGLCLVLFGLLYALLKYANNWREGLRDKLAKEEAHRLKVKDPFDMRNGYNYDYIMVFKVYEEGEDISDMQKKKNMTYIIKRLNQGGLETKLYYSAQNDEVYCKIRCNMKRLLLEADRIDFVLPFDQDVLEGVCNRGREGLWGPLNIPHEPEECEWTPYEFIYGPYISEEVRPDLQALYKRHGRRKTLLRGVDRLKLIQSIMAARLGDGGCHLDIPKLKKHKCIMGLFPFHEKEELYELQLSWFNFCSMPNSQPFDDIKDYMGEKIGLYFVWLAHYTTFVLFAAVFGFAAWINVAANGNDPDAQVVPYFSVFMALWVTVYLESWKRKENEIAMQWGMTGFEETEQTRPQFRGVERPSPVTGRMELFYPRLEKYKHMTYTQTIITLFIGVVAVCIVAIFFLKAFLLESPRDKEVAIGGTALGGIIASLLNAVQIQIFNFLYGEISIKLNDIENHRTDTEYEDNLILKTFMFQFVNSYASLFYIAFLKEDNEGCIDSCMIELQTALGTIFLTRLAVGNLMEVGMPLLKQYQTTQKEMEGVTDKELSPAEQEFILKEYDIMLGPFEDYSEMAIQFGYSTLFVAAFPLALLMSFINNYIEIRVDAWKISQQCRRPEP
jgi:anoctamin-10/anoctamin-7